MFGQFYNTLQVFISQISSDQVILLLLGLLIFLIVFDAIRMILIMIINKAVAHKTTPYSSENQTGKKILIVGDSTGVGTGAKDPKDTISGRLSVEYPHSHIMNLSSNGAVTADVLKQLEQVKDQRFDMIMIFTGGNDVWHFTRLKKLKDDLSSILQLAKQMSDQRVLLLLYNNIGSAPIFSKPVQMVLKRRGVKVQRDFRAVAHENGVPCIELFSNDTENPFLRDPSIYFASDGIHPSSEGYRIWYNRLWRTMVQYGYVFHEQTANTRRQMFNLDKINY